MTRETHPKAWIVVEPSPEHPQTGAPVRLSRRYHVRAAAEAYLDLARRGGHPEAYIRELRTYAANEFATNC